MTNTEKLALLKDRRNKIAARPSSTKAPGALRKIDREIRTLEKAL